MEHGFTIQDLLKIRFGTEQLRIVGSSEGKTFSSFHGTLLAGPHDLTFIAHDRTDKTALLEKTRAQIIIIDPHLPLQPAALHDRCCVIVSNPKQFFAHAVNELFPSPQRSGIHSTAIIDPQASIDPTAWIGPYCIIGHATIGAHSHVDGHAQLFDGVHVGSHCTIKSGAVIGDAGFGFIASHNGTYLNFPHRGKVIIGNHVSIGAHTCIDRGALGNTTIGNNVKIDNLVHIAHNVSVGEGALIIAHAMIGGSTQIGPRAWIAPSAAVRDQLQIGADTTIGLGAVVTKDVPEGETWIGNPARPYSKRPPT